MVGIRHSTIRLLWLAGKITVYLGKRDFVDHVTHVDPIDGELTDIYLPKK